MLSIQAFLKQINTNSVVRENIPMGLGMGYPVLNIAGDRLLITVFYYRSILRPQDQTLLMPPEYMLTFDYPSGKLTSFENLHLDPRYAKVNFDKPAGTFRHEAIRHLDRHEYKQMKTELYEIFDRLIAFLGEEGNFTQEDEKKLAELYGMLAEPCLYPFYRAASVHFFDRYINK